MLEGTEPSLQVSTGKVIAVPSDPISIMLQEIIGCTVIVPEQEAVKLLTVPQFAITLILLYVPSLGLSQSGDPSQLMPVAVSPPLQVKAGGVIGRLAYPEAGIVPQASDSMLEELGGAEDELLTSSELELEIVSELLLELLTLSELELEIVSELLLELLASSELELEIVSELLLGLIVPLPPPPPSSSDEQENVNAIASTMLTAEKKFFAFILNLHCFVCFQFPSSPSCPTES